MNTTTNDNAATVNDSDAAEKVKQLFNQYDLVNDKIAKAEEQVEQGTKERSEIVEQISALVAPLKNLDRDGKALTIVKRDNLYFLRGAKKPRAFKV